MYQRLIKPFFDVAVALILLIVSFPFLLIIAFILVVSNNGKVWFVQERPGQSGKPFRVIKFKTMSDLRDAAGELLPDEDRLSAVGWWIRRLSLDELPQLINVIKGEMSFVGPRPWLMEYLPLYDVFQYRRHEVKPGITGWAQVNGRNALGWSERFKFDVWYVDHISFSLDMKILLMTLIKVFRAEGINSATSVTMEKFKGNG